MKILGKSTNFHPIYTKLLFKPSPAEIKKKLFPSILTEMNEYEMILKI